MEFGKGHWLHWQRHLVEITTASWNTRQDYQTDSPNIWSFNLPNSSLWLPYGPLQHVYRDTQWMSAVPLSVPHCSKLHYDQIAQEQHQAIQWSLFQQPEDMNFADSVASCHTDLTTWLDTSAFRLGLHISKEKTRTNSRSVQLLWIETSAKFLLR